MGYSHTNSKGKTYFLHSKDVELKGGRNQTIYYFAKDEIEPYILVDKKLAILDLDRETYLFCDSRYSRHVEYQKAVPNKISYVHLLYDLSTAETIFLAEHLYENLLGLHLILFAFLYY